MKIRQISVFVSNDAYEKFHLYRIKKGFKTNSQAFENLVDEILKRIIIDDDGNFLVPKSLIKLKSGSNFKVVEKDRHYALIGEGNAVEKVKTKEPPKYVPYYKRLQEKEKKEESKVDKIETKNADDEILEKLDGGVNW